MGQGGRVRRWELAENAEEEQMGKKVIAGVVVSALVLAVVATVARVLLS
jgi:hypothetical protein